MVDRRSENLNHHYKDDNVSDVANLPSCPPIDQESIIDEEKVKQLDWISFFTEVAELKDIIEGKKEEPNIVDEFREEFREDIF